MGDSYSSQTKAITSTSTKILDTFFFITVTFLNYQIDLSCKNCYRRPRYLQGLNRYARPIMPWNALQKSVSLDLLSKVTRQKKVKILRIISIFTKGKLVDLPGKFPINRDLLTSVDKSDWWGLEIPWLLNWFKWVLFWRPINN